MRNKLFVLASLVIIASMLLAACAQPTATTAPQPAQPGVTQIVQTSVVKETQIVKEVQVVTATPPAAAPAKEFKSKDPTTYTLASFGGPETLDPALDYETAGGEVISNVYDPLIWYNAGDPNTFVPSLATEVPSVANGGISADGKAITFKIRQGVKFHDGSDLTVDDVAYTFQRGLLQGGGSSPQWLMTEPILGVGTSDIAEMVDPKYVDDPANLQKADPAKLEAACKLVTDAIVADKSANTVTFKLAQGWAPFLPTVANNWGSIQSKAWVQKGGGWDGDCKTWQNFYGKTSDELGKTPLGTTAMGTGPYILDHWTPGEEIVMKANDSYWRTEPGWQGGPSGVARLKTVIIKYIDEFSTRYAMLQAGDADQIVLGSTADWVQMDTLVGESCDLTIDTCKGTDPDKAIRRVGKLPQPLRTDSFFTFAINAKGNNFIGSGKLDGNGIPPDFFNDEHVRKAFAYCFNYDTYLKDVLQGEGVRSVNVMLPGMIGYNEQDPHYTYDPKKCEEEFKASTLKGADGKSLWDTGFRMTIAYNTGNTARQTAAQIFQQELSAINPNFIVEVTGLPWPTFLKNQRASNLPIFISGWLEDINDTHNWVVPYTTGTYGGRQKMPADLQKQFGDLASQAVVEVDPAKRAAIYAEVNKLFYDNIPTIFLYQVVGRHYEQRWVQDYFYNPIYSGMVFYNMSKQ